MQRFGFKCSRSATEILDDNCVIERHQLIVVLPRRILQSNRLEIRFLIIW